MAKEEKGELVVVQPGFDYTPLATKTANKVKEAAERIRQTVKRTIEDIMGVGNELLAVKDALPHGQFIPWLRAEFGWTERTARNFMAVAMPWPPPRMTGSGKCMPGRPWPSSAAPGPRASSRTPRRSRT